MFKTLYKRTHAQAAVILALGLAGVAVAGSLDARAESRPLAKPVATSPAAEPAPLVGRFVVSQSGARFIAPATH